MKLGPMQRDWLKALRSGDFKQCDGTLYELDESTGIYSNCCLGVACQVAEAHGKIVPASAVDYAFLPISIKNAFGFKDTHGYVGPGRSLSGMNDGGRTFKEIADFVEADPERVFTKSA